MNPPICDECHYVVLWPGLKAIIIDVTRSDHEPHTRDEIFGTYPKTPSWMPGVQALVPLMLKPIHEGRLKPDGFVDLTAHEPHRVYNIAGKGRIATSYDGERTLADLAAERTIPED